MSSELHPTTPQSSDRPFKRGYVACVGCRTRKVRCVLGNKPPCAKCVREHRECVFQNTRKSGKHREAPRWTKEHNRTSQQSNDEYPELASRPNASDSANADHREVDSGDFEDHGPGLDNSYNGEQYLSHRVMSSILARPSDALEVLFDAARPEESTQEDRVLQSRPILQSLGPNLSHNSEAGQVSVSELSHPSEDILDLWDRCRFVRQGWFTAQEAVTYLDLFYLHLAPLSPILSPDSLNHENHERLVTEEPMLCCTLLTISSRFFVLPGAGGVSRSHFIHDRLWQHCEVLIRRVMFGQEKHSTAKTRVVGTIESLMLISDWHPRSVHFPPETNGWDGELISPGYDRQNRLQTDTNPPLIRWREDVFEPAKRSERMSWMLLGAAVNLAYELGIFADGLPGSSTPPNPRETLRMNRSKRLLYVYVTQIACRMGCSSLLPETISFAPAYASAQDVHSAEQSTQLESYLELWVGLTRLIKTASAMFFQSAQYVKSQLMSGNYSILLQHFAPSLVTWLDQFALKSPAIPDALSSLLLIEYHHLKAYTSALSIQAVVERVLAQGVGRFGYLGPEGIGPCILPQDEKFIHDVISDSGKVLEIATIMHHERQLRYAPLRTLICITSASIFLLKAISLGGRNVDLQKSLTTLDRCISALKLSGIDDMDFSLRYATLIENHVTGFCAQFAPPSHPSFSQNPPNAAQRDTSSMLSSPKSYHDGPIPERENRAHGFFDIGASPDEWWTRPFDPSIAPFPSNDESISLGLELDSLDFLLSMPNIAA